MKLIGDYERIADHAVNILQSAEEMEQKVEKLKETLRTRHIFRLQKGECSVDAGFIWAD